MEITKIKTTHIDLTPAIQSYVEEKMLGLSKLTAHYEPAVKLDIEVGKTSDHHKRGPVFRCECNLEIPGELLRVEAVENDLYAAIDKCQDALRKQLRRLNDKLQDRNRAQRPDKM